MALDRAVESVLRRERLVTTAALVALAGLAWTYLLRMAGAAHDMTAMGMDLEPWALADAALAAVMWAVMMVAMMLPSAAPMILVFLAMARRRPAGAGARYGATAMFTLAYLVVWAGFSVVAAASEWWLREAALTSDEARALGPLAGGLLLVAGGVYQLTPLKYACLSRCQSPLGFLLGSWRDGVAGAFVMGVRHGLYCVGCCWLLMALLFAGGVMNLAWVAVLAGFVLAEKVVPAGRVVSRAAGLVLILWGAWSVATAL